MKGIREPIKAYEFMNKFYVEEGNKRVSVLKFFDAVSIPAMLPVSFPRERKKKENKIYYEFMDFYALSHINYIWFTQLGSFAKLQRLVGKRRMKHGAMTTDWILHLLTTVSVPNTRQMAVIKSRLLPVMRSCILSVCMTTVHLTI